MQSAFPFRATRENPVSIQSPYAHGVIPCRQNVYLSVLRHCLHENANHLFQVVTHLWGQVRKR